MKALLGRSLRLLCLVALVLGVVLRVGNLDAKVYWVDEVYTSIRIAGYTEQEVKAHIFDRGLIQAGELRQYQVPKLDQSLETTWSALIQHPEHPPLYFLLGRLWLQGWLQISDNWILGLRYLSVLISLALFPTLYWLCRELAMNRETCWFAIAIVALSPLHLLYAQEARQYSLVAFVVVFASAAFLRAIRRNRFLDWVGYIGTLIIGFYSHLLFGFVVIAQGIYVLSLSPPRKTLMRYLGSLSIGIFVFFPWLIVLANYLGQLEQTIDSTQRGLDLNYLVNVWLRNLSRVFLFINLGSVNFLLFIALGFAIYRLCRDTPRSTWLFIVLLIAIPAVPLMITDGLTGGISSARSRYLIPSYIGIQLAFAHLFTYILADIQENLKRVYLNRIYIGGLAIFMTGLFLASIASSRASATWTKSDKGAYYPEIAMAINETDYPIIVSDSSPGYILALGRLLDDDVILRLVTRPNRLKRNDQQSARNLGIDAFTDIFLFDPSPRLQNVFTENLNYTLETVVEQNRSFQLLKAYPSEHEES